MQICHTLLRPFADLLPLLTDDLRVYIQSSIEFFRGEESVLLLRESQVYSLVLSPCHI